jgi:glucose/arabinose dehydrogenase
MRMRQSSVTMCAVALLFLVAGCSSGSSEPGSVVTTPPASASTSVAATHGVPQVQVVKTLADRLRVPWGVAFLPDGSALVGERPTGQVLRITPAGRSTPVGTVPEVNDFGEGGLLGLAVQAPSTVFAYLTSTAGDNRVVRMTFDGQRLGKPTPVLTGISSADHHNGGLVTIGPDGKLWIGTGEAGVPSRAQDRGNLGGKILRINLDGSIPADNPFPGSPVYSMGHRNVQGLAFDSRKQPWAVEFGQNTWDELNRIVPGGNYGWPIVEGKQAKPGFIEPLVQWPTDQASPSGLAIVDDVAYIGALRGERLWQVPLYPDRAGPGGTNGTTGTPKAWFTNKFGRIRTLTAAPGGGLWMTTSNRDGRGTPGPDDDRVLLLTLQT